MSQTHTASGRFTQIANTFFRLSLKYVTTAAEMTEDGVSSDTVRLRADFVLLFKHCVKCSWGCSVLTTYCAVKKAATSSLFSS